MLRSSQKAIARLRAESIRSRHRFASTSAAPSKRGGAAGWSIGAMSLTTLAVAYHISTSPRLALDAATPSPEAAQGLDRVITLDEVSTHRTKESCWVAVKGVVWDVSAFLPDHPGGSAIILKHAGQDVTELYTPIHPPGTLEHFCGVEVRRVGTVDPKSVPKTSSNAKKEMEEIAANREKLPPVEQVRSLKEMEALAKTILAKRALTYYEGGSDDEVSLLDSFASFQRCRLRPRVLCDVSSVDPRTDILGIPSTLPIYIAPAAHARRGHELGELNLIRGAAKTGIVQGISANSSVSLSDLLDEKRQLKDAGQSVGVSYQIYINRDRKQTEAIIKEAVQGGCASFFLTVDSPTLGNREADFREQGLDGSVDDKPHTQPNKDTFGYYDTSVTWKDLAWIKKHTAGKPIYLKGVATVEDVELAKKYGLAGVVLSNHGGRQIDCGQSPMDTLQEIHERKPELLQDFEIYIDGGARRGTDVLKALCLGARGVGLGRPFLYAQSAYGEQGVIRAVRIMEDEIVNNMRFLGVKSLADLRPEHIECLRPTHRIPGSKDQ